MVARPILHMVNLGSMSPLPPAGVDNVRLPAAVVGSVTLTIAVVGEEPTNFSQKSI